jgi:hypothetical protein
MWVCGWVLVVFFVCLFLYCHPRFEIIQKSTTVTVTRTVLLRILLLTQPVRYLGISKFGHALSHLLFFIIELEHLHYNVFKFILVTNSGIYSHNGITHDTLCISEKEA